MAPRNKMGQQEGDDPVTMGGRKKLNHAQPIPALNRGVYETLSREEQLREPGYSKNTTEDKTAQPEGATEEECEGTDKFEEDIAPSKIALPLQPSLQRVPHPPDADDDREQLSSVQPGAFAVDPSRSGRQLRTRSNVSSYTATQHHPSPLRSQDSANSHPSGNNDTSASSGSLRLNRQRPSNNTLITSEPIIATIVPSEDRSSSIPVYGHEGVSEGLPLRVLMQDRRIRMLIGLLLFIILGLLGGIVALIITNSGRNNYVPPVLGDNHQNEAPVPSKAPISQTLQPSFNPTLAPTFSPTLRPSLSILPATSAPTQTIQRVQELLLSATFDKGEALMNATTPQYQALQQFLLLDPRLEEYSNAQILQRYALGTFYYVVQMAGNTLFDSLNISDECSWPYISCNANGIALAVVIIRGDIRGTLPEEIGLLSSLVEVNFEVNKLTGTLPTTLSRLTNLVTFNVGFNAFSGPIFERVKEMRRLTRLIFISNQLTGTLATEIAALTLLHTLHGDNNKLMGSIQDEFWDSPSLSRIRVRENGLTGTLSDELRRATQLKELLLDSNRLRGSIPTVLALLTNLEAFTVGSNELSGTLPIFEAAKSTRLSQLGFSNNNFRGSMPTEMLLTTLTSLSLQDNILNGTIPTEIGRLRRLTRNLELGSNLFTGTVPTQLGWLTLLTGMFLQDNTFSGSIPSDMGRMTKLCSLRMENNSFLNGTIPTEFGHLSNLRSLHMENIPFLSGTIPTEIGRLSNLQSFIAYNNELTGAVPLEVCDIELDEIELDCNLDCSCCSEFCYREIDPGFHSRGWCPTPNDHTPCTYKGQE